jgi:NAD(P)-dependent dehydrogenase (short-subunit alcohol dehydrogenase family)
MTEFSGSGDALEGKVAVITGAGSGVGRAAARLWSQQGAKVVCADVNREWVEETVRLVEEDDGHPGTAAAALCDVSKEDQVKAAVDLAREKFGRLDVMFANAGIYGRPNDEGKRTIDVLTDEEFDRLIDVNLRGVAYACKHAVIAMNEQGEGGSIVITGSAAGLVAWGQALYGGTKAAVMGMTRALAIEQAPNKIRVNCTAPGGIDTNFGRSEEEAFVPRDAEQTKWLSSFQPLGDVVSGTDVAWASLYLASDAAKNVTGVTLPVDGGHVAV